MGKRRLERIQRTRLRVSANMGERRSEMEWVELEQLSELQRLGSVLPCEMCHVIATAVLLACYHMSLPSPKNVGHGRQHLPEHSKLQVGQCAQHEFMWLTNI